MQSFVLAFFCGVMSAHKFGSGENYYGKRQICKFGGGGIHNSGYLQRWCPGLGHHVHRRYRWKNSVEAFS